jgi:CheY-like chemotaxis protein
MNHSSQIFSSEQQPILDAPEFASILIVDDQRFDRTRVSRHCRAFDFKTHVVEAETLAVMRDKLKKDRFDLILLDYHLTDGTGWEGVEAIRADSVNSDAAIVMVTGTDQSDIAAQALKLGFSDHLSKDELSQETLGRTAIVALQKSRRARGATVSAARSTPLHENLKSFSRECAHDIKPIVTRMMRQMRELREISRLDPQEAVERVEKVEGSLRRLWAFLDDLDQLGSAPSQNGPTVPNNRGSGQSTSSSINARVMTAQRGRPVTKPAKPPSIFRRRPN